MFGDRDEMWHLPAVSPSSRGDMERRRSQWLEDSHVGAAPPFASRFELLGMNEAGGFKATCLYIRSRADSSRFGCSHGPGPDHQEDLEWGRPQASCFWRSGAFCSSSPTPAGNRAARPSNSPFQSSGFDRSGQWASPAQELDWVCQRTFLPHHTPPQTHPTPSPCWREASRGRSKSMTKQVQRTLLPHPILMLSRSKSVTKQVQRTLLPHPTPPQTHPMPTPNSWSGKQSASIYMYTYMHTYIHTLITYIH